MCHLHTVFVNNSSIGPWNILNFKSFSLQNGGMSSLISRIPTSGVTLWSLWTMMCMCQVSQGYSTLLIRIDRLHLKQSWSSVISWSRSGEIPQDTISHNLPEYYFAAKWTSLPHHVFSQIFSLSLSPWLIIFISMKQCAILSFLTRYPFYISIDIQHDVFSPLRADVFPMCFFHFLEHCWKNS